MARIGVHFLDDLGEAVATANPRSGKLRNGAFSNGVPESRLLHVQRPDIMHRASDVGFAQRTRSVTGLIVLYANRAATPIQYIIILARDPWP
jgi:hypothetical protein